MATLRPFDLAPLGHLTPRSVDVLALSRSKKNCKRMSSGEAWNYVLNRTTSLIESMWRPYRHDHIKFSHTTMSVAVATDAAGCSHKLISLNRYKVPPEEVNLSAPILSDEIPANGGSHAEVNIVRLVKFLGWELGPIGATRVICRTCQLYIRSCPAARMITCAKAGPADTDLPYLPP